MKSYSELWNAIDHQRLIGEMRLGIKYEHEKRSHLKIFLVLAEPTALEALGKFSRTKRSSGANILAFVCES